MTRYSILVITTVCVVLSACASATVQPDADGRVHGTVVSVTDGDTVSVKFASGEEKIRLIGVDTPETVHPTKPVGCFGPEASAYTKALLPKAPTCMWCAMPKHVTDTNDYWPMYTALQTTSL